MALVGELIADPRAGALLDLAPDQAGLLELLEPAGEQTVGHAGHRLLELGEAQRPAGERVEDRAGPAAPDQLHRAVEVGTNLFRLRAPGGGRRRVACLRSHLVSRLPIVSVEPGDSAPQQQLRDRYLVQGPVSASPLESASAS